MLKTNYTDKILFYLIIIFSIHFIIKSISTAFTHPFSFDGAIIAQIAQNLATNLTYKTSYWNVPFDMAAIGPTVVFPVALFFKLFSQSFESGLLINAIYIILLFLAILYYLKNCLKLNNYFLLVFIIIFYCTNKLFEYGFGLYGEIPMVFYLILTLILLHKHIHQRKRNLIFWAGFVAGLGFLTKFVFLIIVPGFLFVVLWDFFIKRKEKIIKFLYSYLFFIIGFIVPNLLFELYKLVSIGFKNFITGWYWLLFGAGIQSGVVKNVNDRIKDSPDLFTKINTHIDLLAVYTGLNKFFTVFLLLCGILLFYLFIYFTLKQIKKKSNKNLKNVLNNSVLFLITVMLSYFIWWILITPTDRAWHRRIMPGIILYVICFVVLLFFIYLLLDDYFKNRKKKKMYKIILSVVGLIIILFGAYNFIISENSKISFKWTKEKTEIMHAGRYITTFPADSEFFGFNWWQAPNISFASKKIFKDFFKSEEMKKTGVKQNKFLILDRPAMENQKLCIEKILADFEYELVYVYDEVRIYKLTNRLREREWVEECN